MKTKAVRLYGKNDLRLDTFELPPIKEDEILAKVVSNSICMSTHKATVQGADHKRVPNDIAENPTIMGHEFCGEILEVGEKWQSKFTPGEKFAIQPALNYKGSLDAPGYSYRWIGGNSQYVVIPKEVMEMDCLLSYKGDGYFMGSLAEPVSCIIGSFHGMYHTTPGVYQHKMDIKEGGNMAILAGAGPMGICAIDYAIHSAIKPKLLVVTDIDSARISRAQELISEEMAAREGVRLVYLNTGETQDPVTALMDLTDGVGYDDAFVMVPVRPVIEQGDTILGKDGCLNFFAGPSSSDFKAEMNFYQVHYGSHHIVGISGGNTDDLREALELATAHKMNPAMIVTHIGGLTAAIPTIMELPTIPGWKKLLYTHIDMPLTAIADFEKLGETDPLFAQLAKLVAKTKGMWNVEAEQYLLEHGKRV